MIFDYGQAFIVNLARTSAALIYPSAICLPDRMIQMDEVKTAERKSHPR